MATPVPTTHHESNSEQAVKVVTDPSTERNLDGTGLTIAIVHSRWYGPDVVDPLVEACANELIAKGVESSRVLRVEVSGVFEIPFAASQLIKTKRETLDAVVCIGCMVKGATMAFEFVSEAVTMAIMKLNVKTDTPVVYGVLTCTSAEQARACATRGGSCCGSTKPSNHGVEFALSALELARLKRKCAGKGDKCKNSDCKCDTCKCSDCKCDKCECSDCKCDKCTCSDCKCASGSSSSSASADKTPEASCTSCQKTSAGCDCVGCNCRACSTKSS